jgi:hypothetical protein
MLCTKLAIRRLASTLHVWHCATNLVDDAAARLPEPNPILGSCTCQEVVNFAVHILGVSEVGFTSKGVFPAGRSYATAAFIAAAQCW